VQLLTVDFINDDKILKY